jgi:predicted secreted protein
MLNLKFYVSYSSFLFLWRQTLFAVLLLSLNTCYTQNDTISLSFLEPAPKFHPSRFIGITTTGAVLYTGTVIALDRAWYAQQPRGGFRFFDDWLGWQQIDKAGHALSAYYQSAVIYKGALWTGMPKDKALWTAGITASILQLTIEVMDGFVTTYGFSPSDVVFNSIGVGLFVTQEAIWNRQWAVLKFSTSNLKYEDQSISAINGNETSSPLNRATDLYGSFFAERWLKDYNAQTYWLSLFPFKDAAWVPDWAGISIGYGAGNMFGALNNRWTENGAAFSLDQEYPRYRRFLLSFDVDLTKIKVRSQWLKSLFTVLNVIKVPMPTLSYNTLGQWQFHPIYW